MMYFYRHYNLYAKNTYAIAVSNEVREFVVKYGYPNNRITTIVNGIDLSRITANKITPNNALKTFFALTGRSINVKGIDIVLSASDIVRQKGLEFNLMLTESPEVCEYLKNKYVKIPSWIILKKPTDNISSLFDLADCFISASRFETFSYAIAEATYYGIPVISSDIDGVAWTTDIPSISKFKTEDSIDLANQMESFIKKPFAEDKIISSQKIISDKYSVDNWTENIYQFYQEIMKEN